jgi:glycosyltransferase involved in cell wall biosynthesis
MTSPLLSVIVPTYSRPDFLAAAIQSVLAQTVEDFECIVVDDASPEPARVPSDPRIRLVRRVENGGPAVARNTGLRLARGRYITFLDDDDLYTPDRLALALEGMQRTHLSVCWGRYLHAAAGSHRLLHGNVQNTILESYAPHLGVVTVERAIVPFFDERFVACEDVEWWLRLAQRAPVSTVPRIGYLFRMHDTPRHLITLDARIQGRRRLLGLHAEYFKTRPRAAAFQWKRIGYLARRRGDYALARAAFRHALALDPNLKTLWHLITSLRLSHSDLDAQDQEFSGPRDEPRRYA